MKFKKNKVVAFFSILAITVFIFFLMLAKHVTIQYMSIPGGGELDKRFTVLSSCIYFINESSCMKPYPLKKINDHLYITKKTTISLRNKLINKEEGNEQVIIYCYDQYRKRQETLVERKEIACSNEYAEMFYDSN